MCQSPPRYLVPIYCGALTGNLLLLYIKQHIMGFHRLAEKIGLGKSDESRSSAEVKSNSGSLDLRHGQDTKDEKKPEKGGEIQRPPTPPPGYEPGPERQQYQPQQQQKQQQQPYHQQPQAQPWQQQPPQQSQNQIQRQFPDKFNLYATNYGFSRTFMLGNDEHPSIYAVRLHSGFSSSPPIVLHNGPDPDRCAMLAAVEFATFGGDFTLTLPPMPMPMPMPGTAAVAAASEVEVECDFGLTSRCYRFDVEVGATQQVMRKEPFEWRHSYGAAVDSLGGSWTGWKLVRMARGPPPGASGGSPPGEFVTSDGCEVVAVWAGAGALSFTESARFRFVGTGDTGLLGERWAVAAVMSALGIWEKERREKRRRRVH